MCTSSFTRDGPNTDRCRCDGRCSFFKDCCQDFDPTATACAANYSAPLDLYSDTNLSLWSCRSLYPTSVNISEFSAKQVGVYAVSQCPSTWLARSLDLGLSGEDSVLVQSTCSDAASTLPLASDTATGRVYRNEYCALCHGVSEIALWHHTVLCLAELLDEISVQSQLSVDAVDQHCSSCTYLSPPDFYLDDVEGVSQQPRSCTPAISSCLYNFSEFSHLTFEPSMSIEDYWQIAANCTQQVNYVQAFSPSHAESVIFRNPYCVSCGTLVPTFGQQCFSFDSLSFPLCGVISNFSGTDVLLKLVLNSARGSIQILDLSNSSELNLVENITFQAQCPYGQIFDFVNHVCRNVSCLQFDELSSPCAIAGYPNNSSDKTPVCSEELVLNDPFLLFPLNESTYYYIPLLSLVFVSRINSLGFPVACLDSAVSVELALAQLVKALNALTFVITIPSILIAAFVVFLYSWISKSKVSIFGTVVASFAAISLLNDFALLLGYPAAYLRRSLSFCYAAGILKHVFTLSQFTWMSVHVCDVGLRCYRSSKSLPPRSSLNVLVLYFALGWCLPVIVTAFEVAFAFAARDFGPTSSCFQTSSFWIAFCFYLLPSIVAVLVGVVVALSLLPVLTGKMSFRFSRRDKSRVAVLYALVPIMSLPLLLTILEWSLASRFVSLIIGFFRLFMVIMRSMYFFVVFVLVKKMPKVFGVLMNNKVGPTASVEIEMDERGESLGDLLENPTPSVH